MKDFFNPYSHGFVRLGVATPLVRVGDPQYNLEATFKHAEDAPLLPGRIALYRDGIYVGRGTMARVRTAEETVPNEISWTFTAAC